MHDYEKAGELVLRQLLENGHRHIAWLGARDNFSAVVVQRSRL